MNSQKKKALIPWQLWLVFACAVVNLVMLYVSDGICISPDTKSYEQAIDIILSRGYDVFRTPGYPLYIALCHKILGVNWYYYGIVAGQSLFFLLSLITLWYLIKDMTRSKNVAMAIGLYYAVAPGISTYAVNLLTESITISFTVFLLASVYYMLRYKPNLWSLAAYFISLVALLLMRPGSIAVLGAVSLFVIGVFVLKKRGKYAVVVLTLASLFFPAFQYYKASRDLGVPTSSNVTLTNRYNILFHANVDVTPDCTDNPALRDSITRYRSQKRNTYYEVYKMMKYIGAPAVDSMLQYYNAPYVGFGDRIIEANTSYDLLYGHEFYGVPKGYSPFMTRCTFFAAFRYWLVPLTLLVGFIIMIFQWRRDRRVPWFTLFLLASLFTASFTAILYAPDAFDRLTLPGAPAMLLLWAIPFGKEIILPPYPNRSDPYLP